MESNDRALALRGTLVSWAYGHRKDAHHIASWVMGERHKGEGSTCSVGFYSAESMARSHRMQPVFLEFTSPEDMRQIAALLVEQSEVLQRMREDDHRWY